jgi:predicted transcriptional regulator
MRKSKLENYEDILSALMDRYLSVDSLAFECDMDCVAVNKRLEFLIENQLVDKHIVSKKVLYALTTRGEAVYKTLSLTKRLNKLKKSIEIINEALHAIPSLAEQNEEASKRAMRDENY